MSSTTSSNTKSKVSASETTTTPVTPGSTATRKKSIFSNHPRTGSGTSSTLAQPNTPTTSSATTSNTTTVPSLNVGQLKQSTKEETATNSSQSFV